MSGFSYNGKSTKTILASSELILCSTDGGFDNAIGVERELLGGEPTICRPIVNEYGTNANHLEFRYSLMKANGDDFTEAEQRTVESWLTSPKFSSELAIFDCNDVVRYKYLGKFKLTSWEVSGAGFFDVVNFVFAVNGSYAYEHYSYTFTATSASSAWSFTVPCQTDELEEYVYPKITVARKGSSGNVSMTLTNVTDNSNQLKINTSRTASFNIDCRHCILSANSGSVRFSDLGWNDVGNIYWPRLKAGNNSFSCVGNVVLTFEFDAPMKHIGGWLV